MNFLKKKFGEKTSVFLNFDKFHPYTNPQAPYNYAKKVAAGECQLRTVESSSDSATLPNLARDILENGFPEI